MIAGVLACIGAYCLGFFFRTLRDKVKALEANVVAKIKAKDEDEPASTFIDADDVVQRARFEQQEIERKLNPEKYAQVSEE